MKKEERGFFADGYDRSAYIAAVPNMHPELRIWYRPFGVIEWAKIQQQMRGMELSEEQGFAADKLAGKIIKWSISEPATPERLKSLLVRLFNRIWGIVAGNEAGDVDPEKDDGKREENPTPEVAAKN